MIDHGDNIGKLVDISSKVVATRDGKDVVEWRMKLESGDLDVTCLSFGCAITKIVTRDKHNNLGDVTICHKDYASLSADENRGPYFGCVAGRVANRIARGKFSLNGEEYSLFINNGMNTNHGGAEGFDRKVFDSKEIRNGVEFSYTSCDGEEGFPGTVELKITYCIIPPPPDTGFVKTSNKTAGLQISYFAEIVSGSRSTPINLTNHTYFNLGGGHQKITESHMLKLYCSHYTPVDETQIPMGDIKEVMNTEFDYREFMPLSRTVAKTDGGGRPGVDHNFVVDGALPHMLEPSLSINFGSFPMRPVAVLKDTSSGRVMRVLSTQPGIQVYTANWLSDDAADSPLTVHNGIALESQHFPDSINQPSFPSTILNPGQVYLHRTLWEFSTEE